MKRQWKMLPRIVLSMIVLAMMCLTFPVLTGCASDDTHQGIGTSPNGDSTE